MLKTPERYAEQETASFDYEEAAVLARQKIELEGSEDKLKKSQFKNKIKEKYGSVNTENPERTPAARRIFDLEAEKQRLFMAQEKGQQPEVKTRSIEYDVDQNLFFFKAERGYEALVTPGDLMTDINWGINYELGNNVPVELKRQYLEAIYQDKIRQLHDRQLIIQRTELERNQIDHFLYDTYLKVQADMEKGGGESAGLLFEKMIENLLMKVSLDLAKWGIKVEKASVIEDVELKIDFTITFSHKVTGVGVEEVEDKKLGIQFTLKSPQSEDFRKKQRQVARSLKNLHEVDNLVLISVPIGHDEIFSKYKRWQHQDKKPGGPENFFEPEEVIHFVKEIFKNTELAESPEFYKDLKNYLEAKK